MTQLSRRLEQIVRKELSKTIIPIKTEEGILVGDILIVNQGALKFLYRNQQLLYKEIHLNSVAIKMANILALKKTSILVDKIYQSDQDYGRWYVDSQVLRSQHQKAVINKQFDRADYLWSRYQESRDRALVAKKHAERFIST